MAKRVKDQDAGGHVHKKANARGLTKHVNYCKSQTAAERKPRYFKFCILNETLFEIILSFLSNQALTKMQMITGDRYPNCEPHLASCCCRCEEDNSAIQCGLCRECDSKRSFSEPKVAKEIAKEKYCLRNKDFTGITRISIYGKYTRYDQKELEMRAIELYGSKQAWLSRIARKKQLAADEAAEEQERISYLESLAPGFAKFVEEINWKRRDKMLLKQMSERFKTVNAALEQRGLSLRTYSTPCMDFITTGSGDIQDVIERQFVLVMGSYRQLIREKEAIARAGLTEILLARDASRKGERM